MGKAVKIAISIPQEAFKKLEANRNKEGITRSKFVLKTLRFWQEEKEKEHTPVKKSGGLASAIAKAREVEQKKNETPREKSRGKKGVKKI